MVGRDNGGEQGSLRKKNKNQVKKREYKAKGTAYDKALWQEGTKHISQTEN